jgi:hypothetical protein
MIKEFTPNFEISKEDQHNLEHDFIRFVLGLSKSNWVRGGNFGTARQKALEQAESFLKSKNSNNPVIQHLHQMFMKYQARWAKSIMTSKKSEAECPKDNMDKSKAWGAKWVNESLGKLNNKIKQFEPKTNTYANAQQVVQDKMPKQAVIIEMQNADLTKEQVSKMIQVHLQQLHQKVA